MKLNFKFNRSGLMKITFSTESVDAQPYRNQMLLFFDVMSNASGDRFLSGAAMPALLRLCQALRGISCGLYI